MVALDTSLAGVHAAVHELLAHADVTGDSWAVPRAPGKWSPSQLVEHVSRIMDESAKVAAGGPSSFPTMNPIVRVLARTFFFKRSLRNNAFPAKSKTIPALDPAVGSENPTAARIRLEAVLARFEQASRARAATGQNVESTLFGAVPVGEFARFQELHVRHHLLQMLARRTRDA